MLVPKVNVVLQADKDIGSITEADIWLNCMDGNGNFLSVAAEDHTGDGHYIATLPLDYSPVEPFIQVHLNEMVYDYLSIPNFKAGQECQISLILGTDAFHFLSLIQESRHLPSVPLVLHVFFPFRCEGFTTKGLEKKKHIAELKIRPS